MGELEHEQGQGERRKGAAQGRDGLACEELPEVPRHAVHRITVLSRLPAMGDVGDKVIGPVDPMQVPRFAGPATYARLPALDAVGKAEVAILGVPFDSGVVYRPGARFGPAAIRAGSKMLRPFNAWTDTEPFAHQVADAGDIACTPFGIEQAIGQIEEAARATGERASHLVALGGDHTIALPLLRAAAARF